jgi:ketosteroid isomerase-like protein
VSYSYALTIRDANGVPFVDKGKDVTVYRKADDGAWQVVVDMWSENVPPTSPA